MHRVYEARVVITENFSNTIEDRATGVADAEHICSHFLSGVHLVVEVLWRAWKAQLLIPGFLVVPPVAVFGYSSIWSCC